MAPGYKPIALGALPAGLSSLFQVKAPLTLNNAIAEEETLQGVELQNQAREIQVAEAQRQESQNQRRRDLLTEKFGTLSPDQFDPNEAFRVIQGLALQEGDSDTALNVERVISERQYGRQGYQPLTEAQRQFLAPVLGNEIPEGITEKDVSLRSTLERGNIYGQQVAETKDKRQDGLQSLAPGGFTTTIDPATGQGPTVNDGKKFTATVAAHSRINSDLDALEASFQVSGGNDPSHPEFQRQKAILGDIMIALKEKNNFGAALTVNEQMINNSGLPQVFSRIDSGLGEAFAASGLGRDPIEAVRNMRALLSTDFDQQATIYKFQPKANNGLPAAQSGQSFRIPRANNQQPVGSSSSLPKNSDGTALTREQFMALRNGGQ